MINAALASLNRSEYLILGVHNILIDSSGLVGNVALNIFVIVLSLHREADEGSRWVMELAN